MSPTLARQVLTALSEFSSDTRLYELTLERDDPGLLVEAFAADEQLQAIGTRDVIALSTRAAIPHSSFLGQQAKIGISLADGNRAAFGGYVSQVATLGRFPTLLLLLTVGVLAACHDKRTDVETRGVGAIVGANYTNHGIQWFSVDESAGESLGMFSGGGGSVCCARYPKKWTPGFKVTVRWERSDGREPDGLRWKIKRIEKVIEVEPYTVEGNVYVLFLPDDRVKVTISDVGVGNPTFPSNPGYPEAAAKMKGLK